MFKLFHFLAIMLLFYTPSLQAYNLDRIKSSLIKEFKKTYPSMSILHLYISPISSKPKDFSHYNLKALYISKASLKNNHGTFYLLYRNQAKERKIFFKYLLDAKIALYKAAVDIPRNTPLDKSDLVYEESDFKRILFTPIDQSYLYHYITKHKISKGEIITTKDLMSRPDVKRGDELEAFLYSSGVVANFSVKAMQKGRIGDIIRVKKDRSKSFKARITSSTSVEIID